MIVREYDGGIIGVKRLFDDFTGIHAGAIAGTAKYLGKAQDLMAVVEINAAEELMRQMGTYLFA